MIRLPDTSVSEYASFIDEPLLDNHAIHNARPEAQQAQQPRVEGKPKSFLPTSLAPIICVLGGKNKTICECVVTRTFPLIVYPPTHLISIPIFCCFFPTSSSQHKFVRAQYEDADG